MTPEGIRRAKGRVTWVHAAVTVWAVLLAGVAVRCLAQPNAHDCWKPFYEPAGRNWLHGVDLYQDTYGTCRYSPLVNALFAPLALLPSAAGGLAWRAVNAAAFLGGLFWWLRVYAPPGWTRTHRALAFVLVIPLSISTINGAQANPLLAGLLLAATAAAGRERWNWAAAFAASACLLKIYPIAFALLLVVAFPRRFTPRFLIALATGLALPFLLQDPLWVGRQYGNWWTSLCIDDRTQWPFDKCYRDLWMLIRFYQLRVSYRGYVAIQLGIAAATAAVCLAARLRARLSRADVANAALGLAACWMTVCGPSTEGGGYILVAPTLAWAFVESWRRPWPWWVRGLLLASAAMFTTGAAVTMTRNAGWLMAYGWHPNGGLLLLAALLGDAVRRNVAPAAKVAEAVPAARGGVSRHRTGVGDRGVSARIRLPRKRQMTTTKPLLSVVSPVYQEEEVLPHFHRALGEVLDGLADEYDAEILLVDDGSRDGTLPLLRRLAREDPRVRYLSFSRNFGHQAAITAGLERARGDVVVTLDSDLQHPPSLIPALLQKYKEGHDVVLTLREERPSNGVLKRIASGVFFHLMRLLSERPVRDAVSDYQLLSRKALDALLSLRESHRYLRGMVNWLGFPTASVPFRVAPREAGASKFTFGRLSGFAVDALLSFSKIPLRLPFFLGAAAIAVGLGYALWGLVWAVVNRGPWEPGWITLLATLHLLGGSILCSLSLVGEYVGRIYEQVKGRPLYLLKESSPDADAIGGRGRRDEASAA